MVYTISADLHNGQDHLHRHPDMYELHYAHLYHDVCDTPGYHWLGQRLIIANGYRE